MGKMKEIYMQVMHANDGIPEEMTIEDIIHMQELKIYEWQEYEREKQRLQYSKSENSGEIAKAAKSQGYWQEELRQGQTRRTKKD
jgi:hypothetical protein